MKALKTAREAPVTERQKAWGRLALLTVVGLVCPPLAAARSGAVWGVYLLLLVLYSLWTIRLTRTPSKDSTLGYLLCVADVIVLVPIIVWSLDAAMPVVLMILWALGVAASWSSARASRALPAAERSSAKGRVRGRPKSDIDRLGGSADGAPLERALRVRLKVLREEGNRFALVLLKVGGYEAMIVEEGKEATKEFLRDIGHRGLHLLGPDAQLFPLPGGRMAFVFATDSARAYGASSGADHNDRVDPYDIESLAMALAGKACEHTLGGHRLECVAGWASAPADGVNVDDLMFAAESGALSADAYRRVGGSRVAVPEQKRAIAG